MNLQKLPADNHDYIDGWNDCIKEIGRIKETKDYENFEYFLEEQHAIYYTGCDDDMPEAFSNWQGNLDVDELIELADKYAQYILITR